MAKRKNITCIKYNDSKNYGWVSHSTADKLIEDGKAVEWDPENNAPAQAETPTMDDTKDEIVAYLVARGIDHDTGKTKSQLLALV